MFGYDPAFGQLFVVTPFDIQQSTSCIIKLMCQRSPQQDLKGSKPFATNRIFI
jgi:hypothetical protein